MEKLPKAAREYLAFLEKESEAQIGMVSTGPGREQTIFLPEFQDLLKPAAVTKNKVQAKA